MDNCKVSQINCMETSRNYHHISGELQQKILENNKIKYFYLTKFKFSLRKIYILINFKGIFL